MHKVTLESPPKTPKEIRKRIGPQVFDPNTVAAKFTLQYLYPDGDLTRYFNEAGVEYGLAVLKEEFDRIREHPALIAPHNGVMILGPAASGKTTTANMLIKKLRYMRHKKTGVLFQDKKYTVQLDPHMSEEEKAVKLWDGYIGSRMRAVQRMQVTLKNEEKPLSTDEIAIAGFPQTIISLCAYTHTYEINPDNGMLMLPKPLLYAIVLSLTTWSPRFFVLQDSELETRRGRAQRQAEQTASPAELQKRSLAFENDRALSELYITTLRSLSHLLREIYVDRYGREKAREIFPFRFVYCSSHAKPFTLPPGFDDYLFNAPELASYVERNQSHRARDNYWARAVESTWGDE